MGFFIYPYTAATVMKEGTFSKIQLQQMDRSRETPTDTVIDVGTISKSHSEYDQVETIEVSM